MAWRRLAAVGMALVVALAAAALALRGSGAEPTATARGLPPPVRPAFVPGPPRPLAGERYRSRWASVQRPVPALTAPRAGAPVVAAPPTRHPEGPRHIVL